MTDYRQFDNEEREDPRLYEAHKCAEAILDSRSDTDDLSEADYARELQRLTEAEYERIMQEITEETAYIDTLSPEDREAYFEWRGGQPPADDDYLIKWGDG